MKNTIDSLDFKSIDINLTRMYISVYRNFNSLAASKTRKKLDYLLIRLFIYLFISGFKKIDCHETHKNYFSFIAINDLALHFIIIASIFLKYFQNIINKVTSLMLFKILQFHIFTYRYNVAL